MMLNRHRLTMSAPLAAAVVLVAVGPLLAQLTGITNDQSRPIPAAGHSYTKLLAETVNPANGSVSLRLAVPVPAGRGFTLPFSFSYDSDIYINYASGGTSAQYAPSTNFSSMGWSYSVPTLTYHEDSVPVSNYACTFDHEFVFQAPNGSTHALYLGSWHATLGGTCTQVYKPSGGDDRYSAAFASCQQDEIGCIPLVRSRDGIVFDFTSGVDLSQPLGSLPGKIEDENGNYVTITTPNPQVAGSFQITDSLGRPEIVSSGFGVTGNTVTVAGLGGPYTLTWGTAAGDFGLGSQQIYSVRGGCTVANAHASGPAITGIQMPDGQAYSFSYDSTYGLLSKVTYHGGGFVEYSWAINPLSEFSNFADYYGDNNGCQYRHGQVALAHRYVSFDGTNIALQQDFSYTTTWASSDSNLWTEKSTTVTTHDLITGATYTTVYNYTPYTVPDNISDTTDIFSSQVPLESEIQYYGSDGSLLKTVKETWTDPYLQTSTQTIWPTGEVAEKDYAYSGTDLLTEEDDYDYGSGGRGGLLRKRLLTYTSCGNDVDMPATEITEDGSGNRVAETDYAYDQATPGGPSGVVGKDYTSGNCGLLTTESGWDSTTGSALSTTFTYDNTGRLLTETSPLDAALGKTTETISYADEYASGSGTPPGPTDAYPTTITDALGHTREYTWNYASGELASSTGENGNPTSYAYSDPLARLTQVNYPPPAGGETTYTYDDSAPSPSVTTSKEISPGNWLTTVSVRDGMGQVVESETTSDTVGADYVKTTYDGLGQVLAVTNPYRATNDPTYGVTTYAYDGLGRTKSVTHPDGAVVNTTYTGRATEVTDEGNGSYSVTRVSQVDGLGRLTSVCEVDATAMPYGGGATPATCGQDVAATGFLTTYGYDTLGDLTSVTQSGLNARSFSYDSLSRLLSAENPESGTVHYNYDTAACGTNAYPGELTCRTDARGVTTAYSYDADSRVLTKTYSDGTPQVEFAYGQGSSWGVTLANPVGRLTTAETVANGAMQTGEIFSYDSMGWVAMNQECVPLDCGSGNYQLNYAYDFLGDTTSAGNGAGVTLTSTYNNADQLSSITSSLSDANHPGTLFSLPSYDAGGQLTGFSYGTSGTEVETDTYNDRMQLTSRSVTGAAGVDPKPGQGSISISGAEQSVQVPSTHSTGRITIQGSEGAYEKITCPRAPAGKAVPEIGCTYTWYYDHGDVYLVVNGVTVGTSYAENSTDANVATGLSASVNADNSMPVSAYVSGDAVILTSKGTGTGVNYSLGTSCDYTHTYWSACSFSGSLSGSAMTGGSDTTTYDSGTVSAVINGQGFNASYGQGSTTASIASALAGAINSGSSYATASPSGASLIITARTDGVNTNYSLSASSATSDPSQFSSPSFSPSTSGSALTGGQNGQGSGAYSVTGITYAPDGDVAGATDSVNGQWQYEYGPLNRLLEACSDTCSSPTTAAGYVYDRFGNRWQENPIAGTIWSSAQLSFDANNHIVSASYDASGDLLEDAYGNTYAFDAEGRIASATAGGGAVQYVYNAFGQRVEKLVGGVAKYYLYSPAGQAATVLDQNGNWLRGEIFAGGRHFATYGNATTYFDYSDWLGTLRMAATLAGYEQSACTSGPFGEGLNCSGAPTPLQFTGQQHDAETGLDHFPARNYTSSWGRWLTPDPLGGHLVDPQSLNLYAYGWNNPVTFTDPTGHYVCADSTKGHACTSSADKALAQSLANALKSKNADVVRAAEAYGKANVDNGVTVAFGDPGKGSAGTTVSQVGYDPNSPNLVRADSDITLQSGLSGAELDAAVAHEGSHAADAQEEVEKIAPDGSNLAQALSVTQRQSEQRAYGVTGAVLASEGVTGSFCPGDCRLGAGVLPAAADRSIQQILSRPPYSLAPGASGPPIIIPVTTVPH
ncbi:MAG: RHS repeat-associated core domain-containing protein [Terriglobales bacterium]